MGEGSAGTVSVSDWVMVVNSFSSDMAEMSLLLRSVGKCGVALSMSAEPSRPPL